MAETTQAPLPPPPEESLSPGLAALLTWFVPGAGHFYLGKVRTAAIAFGVIQGLYLVGALLSKGLFLQILPPEMRGRFAGALTPEAGNLGALLLHARQVGYGDGTPQAFPSTMHLGVMLTASAGILNLILASRAHFDARIAHLPKLATHDPHPAKATLLAWLLPGAGHFAQGRKARGVVAFVLVVGLFLLGCALADGTNLARTRHFYYWAGQSLLGPIAFLAETINGHAMMTERVAYSDAGVVLASIAGMLNVMLMLDVYGYSDARLLGRPIATDDEPAEGTEPGSDADSNDPGPDEAAASA